MRILRVFPRRTADTPDDDLVAIGDPGFWRPEADRVHVSVAFTWDVPRGEYLREAWAEHYPDVRLGGPAIGGEGDVFVPGRYLRPGITITSRGCPNACPWCLVRSDLRELDPVPPGSIIQDNNILATSRAHFLRVMGMLRSQRLGAVFRGGLETRRLTDWHVDKLRTLRSILELWFACDTEGALKSLRRAVAKFPGFHRNKLRCYVLIGRDETIEKALDRLEDIWQAGCLPFAQLYQAPTGPRNAYSAEWRKLAKQWSRPAITKELHRTKGGSK